mmetsp:Transcript_10029/g.26640  ORF Transcript_10029/g.26640 Transcript_10029/m.26640 type:complete len:386 (-) Transcript_10029:67-1224(-)
MVMLPSPMASSLAPPIFVGARGVGAGVTVAASCSHCHIDPNNAAPAVAASTHAFGGHCQADVPCFGAALAAPVAAVSVRRCAHRRRRRCLQPPVDGARTACKATEVEIDAKAAAQDVQATDSAVVVRKKVNSLSKLLKTKASSDDEDEQDEDADQPVRGVGRFIKRRAEPAEPDWTLDDLPVIPFLGQPAYREYCPNFPGDAGFDPLNLSRDKGTFLWMAESEIKHGRLAMLACIGWPASEYLQPKVAEYFFLPDLLAEGGRAPSVLNGGFGDPTLLLIVLLNFTLLALSEGGKSQNSAPGDYKLDILEIGELRPPLINGFIPPGRFWNAEAEVKHGRLAMIAITIYVIEEFIFKQPIIELGPAQWFAGTVPDITLPNWGGLYKP